MAQTLKSAALVLSAAFLVGHHDSGCTPEAHAKDGAAASAVPSFRRDILPVFDRQCSSAKGCHGSDPTDSVALDLRAAAAYAQLVNHASETRKGAARVRPGDPDSSLLVDKLTGVLDVAEGKRMPIDADTGAPIEPSPLPPGFIDGVLKPWIRRGAPNN